MPDHLRLLRYVLRWILITAPVAALIGSACAGFLWLLERTTQLRESHGWLLYFLPVAGVGIALLYRTFGKTAERGNNLIMDEINEPGAGVPISMAPLVLIGTVVTHLFGGSAGREGTAVQIGGSFAGEAGRRLKLPPDDVRQLLKVGIAAGFAGIFGTPLAGMMFALEVTTIGRVNYAGVFPCLIAAIVGDYFCQVWGIHHTAYHIALGTNAFDWLTAAKVVIAAIAFGFASVIFAQLTHGLHKFWRNVIPFELLRPVVGACAVIAIVWLLGTRDYIGLGVTSPNPNGVSILSSFSPGGATPLSWWWKTLLTAITLSCGFKGGEVTPLFFVGATLGNTLSGLMHAPTDLFAGLGFVAVFAGATNTPLACTLMGIELFGADHTVYLAIACFTAYLFSGHHGVYTAQRIGTAKPHARDAA